MVLENLTPMESALRDQPGQAKHVQIREDSMRQPRKLLEKRIILHKNDGLIEAHPWQAFYTTKHRVELWDNADLRVVKYWKKELVY